MKFRRGGRAACSEVWLMKRPLLRQWGPNRVSGLTQDDVFNLSQFPTSQSAPTPSTTPRPVKVLLLLLPTMTAALFSARPPITPLTPPMHSMDYDHNEEHSPEATVMPQVPGMYVALTFPAGMRDVS